MSLGAMRSKPQAATTRATSGGHQPARHGGGDYECLAPASEACPEIIESRAGRSWSSGWHEAITARGVRLSLASLSGMLIAYAAWTRWRRGEAPLWSRGEIGLDVKAELPSLCNGAQALNDFSSRQTMEAAGWSLNWTGADAFKPQKVFYGVGVPIDSYWGFRRGGVGAVSLILRGRGLLELDFGNSWDLDLVTVRLNGEAKSSAGANTPSKLVSFPFQDGDLLEIVEALNAVIVINSVELDCNASADGQAGGGGRPRSRPDDSEAEAGTLPLLLEVGTSVQGGAQRASGASASFQMAGAWTSEAALVGAGQIASLRATVSRWPTALRLRARGYGAWGYEWIRIRIGNETQTLLNSANGAPYGANRYWVDLDGQAPAEQLFLIPKAGLLKPESCAAYSCQGYTPLHRCQCNPSCESHGNCCFDYSTVCVARNIQEADLPEPSAQASEKLQAIFGTFDWNGDGRLSLDELDQLQQATWGEHFSSEAYRQLCTASGESTSQGIPAKVVLARLYSGPGSLDRGFRAALRNSVGVITLGEVSAPHSSGDAGFCNKSAPLPHKRPYARTFALSDSWRTKCANLGNRPNGAADFRGRNWCWAWMKFEGCLWTKGHWTWWEAQERLSQMGKAPDPHKWPFQPLLNASLCERPVLGRSLHTTAAESERAKKWVLDNLAVYVLNLPADVGRWHKMVSHLKRLGLEAERILGVDLTQPGELEAVREEGLMPRNFSVEEAQQAASIDMGGITGTIGVASAHFRALMRAQKGRGRKPLALILEDDTELADDFHTRLWRVLSEAPCDWLAISLKSRCPYGECVTPHLTRVRPDGNEPLGRCYHGVNYGFYAMLYRSDSLDFIRRKLNATVWREQSPHCFDIDVALASISEEVPYYAVPAAQQPGLLREGNQGSRRYTTNSLQLPK
mmetsp:Transcript_72404/g.162640  ORF Transcript_72404/g.162640 Transcript_72404/m.162640 type:complete len:912 (-) Transcript_72404:156-2891(-)